MKGYVGVTDREWVRFLSAIPGIDEVNFWKPGSVAGFKALVPGEPFLFKLKAPSNMIVGGGFFAHFSRLPCSLAWDAFGEKNGAPSFEIFKSNVRTLKHAPPSFEDFAIGCILLEQPFFFPESDWIPTPLNWKPNIVSGLTYDLDITPGRELWDAVQLRLSASRVEPLAAVAAPLQRYGSPIAVTPRLGQGSFRVIVTDAYGRKCAASGERSFRYSRQRISSRIRKRVSTASTTDFFFAAISIHSMTAATSRSPLTFASKLAGASAKSSRMEGSITRCTDGRSPCRRRKRTAQIRSYLIGMLRQYSGADRIFGS